MNTPDILESTRNIVQNMQNYEVNKLPRTSDLGKALDFSAAVSPAQKIVELYRKLSIRALEDLPDSLLNNLKSRAEADYKTLNKALEFTPANQNPKQERDRIIEQIRSLYQSTFSALYPIISYSISYVTDFNQLDAEARDLMDNIRKEVDVNREEINNIKVEANNILDEVKNTAAEQGVSQQAIYFGNEADYHDKESRKWRTATILLSIGLTLYAILTIFITKISYLSPTTTYETIQLGLSKILIFSVISYMLYLSARNFMTHNHNCVINKHRQNALRTYQALVDAGGDRANRDIVLLNASSCIFSPQVTGFSKADDNQGVNTRSVFELLAKNVTESTQ